MYALKAVAHAADLTTRSLKPTAALTVASMAPVTKELLQSIGATRVAVMVSITTPRAPSHFSHIHSRTCCTFNLPNASTTSPNPTQALEEQLQQQESADKTEPACAEWIKRRKDLVVQVTFASSWGACFCSSFNLSYIYMYIYIYTYIHMYV